MYSLYKKQKVSVLNQEREDPEYKTGFVLLRTRQLWILSDEFISMCNDRTDFLKTAFHQIRGIRISHWVPLHHGSVNRLCYNWSPFHFVIFFNIFWWIFLSTSFIDKTYSVPQSDVQLKIDGNGKLYFMDDKEQPGLYLNLQMKVYAGELINTFSYLLCFIPINNVWCLL